MMERCRQQTFEKPSLMEVREAVRVARVHRIEIPSFLFWPVGEQPDRF
jgi:hypothetical protein